MKCQQCVAEKTLSKVFALGGSRTLMGFQSYYDEDGKPHSHDPNKLNQSFRCTNGHTWSVEVKIPCPTCGEDWK